jgi:CheY-like chemotaxis protein
MLPVSADAGRSHMSPYLEILRPLRQRGHNVTIVADPHDARWLHPHYPEFQVLFVPKAVHEYMTSIIPTLWPMMIRPSSDDTLRMVLEHLTLPTYRTVATSLRSILEQQRPDLLLCDLMSNPCTDLAHTLDIPYAVTMSGIPNGGNK